MPVLSVRETKLWKDIYVSNKPLFHGLTGVINPRGKFRTTREKAFKSRARGGAENAVYRRIFVYTFCLINICLSLSNDANKIKTLNIERA